MVIRLQLVRAIAFEFISRKFQSILIVSFFVGAILTALMTYLVSVSAWWLVVAVPIYAFVILITILSLITRVVISMTSPSLSADQSLATRHFVDKLERVAETVQTPLFIIVLQLLRDSIKPRKKTYLASVIEDSTSLKPEFAQLQVMFDKK